MYSSIARLQDELNSFLGTYSVMTQGSNYMFDVEWLIHYQWKHVQQLSACYTWTNIYADRCGKAKMQFLYPVAANLPKYSSVLLK